MLSEYLCIPVCGVSGYLFVESLDIWIQSISLDRLDRVYLCLFHQSSMALICRGFSDFVRELTVAAGRSLRQGGGFGTTRHCNSSCFSQIHQ